ncbi:MAG: hypothetical protein WC217_01315 [Candidatus Paceibacterota bacterium]|jgi:hypothetical protein
MERNIIIGGLVTALIVGGALGYAGASYQYGTQLDKARAAFPMQPTMLSVSGTVESVSGSVITLKSPPSSNPFETLPSVRKVTVTEETRVIRSEEKDPKVWQQEMADYQKLMQKDIPGRVSTSTIAASLATPPMPFKEVIISFSDLKAGDLIFVTAAEDIKTATSFEATGIRVTEKASVAAPAGTAAAQGTAPIVNTQPPPITGTAAAQTAPIVDTPPLPKK